MPVEPDQPIPDASPADVQEQQQDVTTPGATPPVAPAPATSDPEAPAADAQEQAEVVPEYDDDRVLDDDDRAG